uniref:K Homology domain-containing protein n=1 Tax=Chromera velia CCMP2878 TaxID=1169474 RepID=A0A0G4I4U7_9ALVE|eukprot:Cvel_1814.t1-p1 / transcript=Cvel_1814.t1 / gene=Cvel_1814 / organism=Chromera_velia_CCMP2878 / gene_product=hypothetical protein / transcript_product=hypothetical protein / location=Cvel_scaffold67:9473-13422(+) / protein_length=243 / sequence_SO=supercontig / SO=protein_coding / is_pseudo=false
MGGRGARLVRGRGHLGPSGSFPSSSHECERGQGDSFGIGVPQSLNGPLWSGTGTGTGSGTPPVVIEVDVPACQVPRLVGTRGALIREFSLRTGATFECGRSVDVRGMKKLSIRGSAAQVEAGRSLVVTKLGMWSALESPDRTVVLQVPVSQKYIGCLMGLGGATVAEISLLSGAIIDCGRDARERAGGGGSRQQLTESDVRVVTLRGTAEAVEKAREIIEAKIEGEGRRRMMASSSSSSSANN